MSILKAKQLKKYYGSEENLTKALDGVDLSIEKGEFVAIIGASGSGKSTLLNMIGGLDIPTSGKVVIGNKEIEKMKPDELTVFRRKNIGFIFQNYNLIPVLNVLAKVFIKCSDRAISCYAICPLNADEDTRPVVAEYLTRANYGLNNGNFEMDYSDGEIRYKTYMLCSQHVPDIKEVELSVDLSFLMMKRYGNGLAKALMGFGEPEKDIAEAEKD